MQNSTRVVNILVACLSLYVMYDFWVGSGVFAGYFVPETPAEFQSLGAALEADNPAALQAAGFADIMSRAVELLAWLLSSFGAVIIMGVTKGSEKLGSIFSQLWASWQVRQNGINVHVGSQQSLKAGNMAITEQMPAEQVAEYTRVLQQAIVDKDAVLTVKMAEKLAGEDYISEELDENGFPVISGE